MNKTLIWTLTITMVLLTVVIAARAEPKIFPYNFTIEITRGDLINTTICLGNGSNSSGPSFFQGGNVNIHNLDFNITYNASFDTSTTKNFLSIRDIPTNCQTDDILSLLVNTTQAVANSSITTYNSQQQLLQFVNGSSTYIDKFAECKEVNGQVSVKEVICNGNLATCTTEKSNATAERTLCDTNLQSKNAELSSCQTSAQGLSSELQKCRTDLASKGSTGTYLFAALAGFGIAFVIFNKKNEPPDIANFPIA